ncbi:MAG: fucose permease [Algoriphagus sp.]|jgi:fucose permease
MRQNTFIVALIFFIFFVISFLSNILGPIIPDILNSFELGIGLAGLLPFSFFISYGLTSIPAGVLVEKYKEKKVLLIAFFLAFLGALFFVLIPIFPVALLSLFIIGTGMAMLQVVINPLLRVAGGGVNFAFNSVMAQLFFGGASFLSPMLYSYFVKHVHAGEPSNFIIENMNKIVPSNLAWISLYWVFAIIALLMIVIIKSIKFPKVELAEDERIETGNALRELLKDKKVILFFIGIFCYVGTEQGIANWTSKFLQEYHGVDPATLGASIISYFWGLLTIGCFLGLILLKLFDSRKVLISFTIGAIVALLLGLFGPLNWALVCFPLTGFFASVMWSIVVSLALNSLAKHHGTFSGILCTGIAGGAFVPLIIGGLGELVGLRLAMLFLLVTLGYILSIGFWAKPLVTNSTIKNWKEIFHV